MAKLLALATIALDTGDEYASEFNVQHPTRVYEGRVLDWGLIERNVPIVSGLPQITFGSIRIADTDQKFRDLLAHHTPRRRLVDVRLVEAGASVAAGYIVFGQAEIVNASFGPGYVELKLRDRLFSWLDEEIPAMITKDLYPEVLQQDEGGFLNIIFGQMRSPVDNPEGMVPCPHVAADLVVFPDFPQYKYDRYGLAAHRVYNVVAVYRRDSAQGTWSVVDEAEYNVTVFDITAFNVDMHHTFLDFLAPQNGAEIRADVDGLDFRGEWGVLPQIGSDPEASPVTGTPQVLRNPVDAFINMTFFILAKAGASTVVFDTVGIAALWDRFDAAAYYCDGAVINAMTAREFLGRFLPSFDLTMFAKHDGLITLDFTPDTDAGRPVFTQGHLMLEDSFFEDIPDPVVTQIVYRYNQNPAADTWLATGDLDNTIEATAIAAEKEDIDLYFVADPTTADTMMARRIVLESLGSYRPLFQLPAPEVLGDVELCKLVGITHKAGLETTTGYVNREVKIYSLSLDLKKLTYTVRTVLRANQALS